MKHRKKCKNVSSQIIPIASHIRKNVAIMSSATMIVRGVFENMISLLGIISASYGQKDRQTDMHCSIIRAILCHAVKK